MKITTAPLVLGKAYSKSDLAEIFQEPDLAGVREGWFHKDGHEFIPFFVTLNKEKRDPSVAYNDFFEDGLFFWDSQSGNTLESKWVRKFRSEEVTPLLFVREVAKVGSKTQKYTYAGRLIEPLVDEASSKPVKFSFLPADLSNGVTGPLLSLIEWKPGHERRPELNEDFAAKLTVKKEKQRRTVEPGASTTNSDANRGYRPGPTPGQREYSVSSTDHKEWYVYVLVLSENMAAKVGLSHDPESRLREYNRHILTEITGLTWKLAFFHRVSDAETALRVEQEVLNKHAGQRLPSNGEVLKDVNVMNLQLDIIRSADIAHRDT